MRRKPSLKICKRDSSRVPFNETKIETAILKAALEVMEPAKARNIAGTLTRKITKVVKKRFVKRLPRIEDIQDIVEKTLMDNGYVDIAKRYILYRHRRRQIRDAKSLIGVKDELKLSLNAIKVLERRYLLRDRKQNVTETAKEMFQRVAKAIAGAEAKFSSVSAAKKWESEFYKAMANLEFLPNSPTLMNAGTKIGQLSACFVIPVKDSMEGIFGAIKNTALIHQTGGGTGFSFSDLRPRGDIVDSTKGIASGPVSFMRIFDTSTSVIVQGGRRRGANMGILRCDHPDILDFIQAKVEESRFSNFNISVAVTDKFMEAVKRNREYSLINPRSRKDTRKISAREVFNLIADMAWKTGDPGLIFIDEINRRNPTPQLGNIESTNPCGELPLLPYESCNLGSINVSRVVENKSVDWDRLGKLIHLGIRFLDDVIEVNKFVLPEIKKITLGNRKVGLGVMGFADALVKLGIPYNSTKSVDFAKKLMGFIRKESINASVELATERGVFPNFKGSVYYKKGLKLRNATLNTIAPTGTISILADCSSGIEPIFALCFVRSVLEGTKLVEVNKLFESIGEKQGFLNQNLIARIARSGSISRIKSIPEDMRKIFVTAFDVSPSWHLKIQAAFQRYTDNSVSKTINLPSKATPDDVKRIYMEAYRFKCKGITVYRYGSKQGQVLSLAEEGKEDTDFPGFVSAGSEYAGGCPNPHCPF